VARVCTAAPACPVWPGCGHPDHRCHVDILACPDDALDARRIDSRFHWADDLLGGSLPLPNDRPISSHDLDLSSDRRECPHGCSRPSRVQHRRVHRVRRLAAVLPRSHSLPFGRLWYGEPDAINNAVGYAKFRSRSHDAVTRVYDEAGNMIETHEHAGDLKES